MPSSNATAGIPLSTISTAESAAAQLHGSAPTLDPQNDHRRKTSPDSSSGSGAEKSSPFRKPGGKRRVDENGATIQDGERAAHLNFMGKLYDRLGAWSLGARWALYILPLGILIVIPITIGAVYKDLNIGGVRLVWFCTWLEATWLTLWAMKLVAKALPFVFAFFAGAVNTGTKRYARVLQNLETTIMILGWVIISFVLFQVLFNTSAAGNQPLGWVTWATRVLGAVLVATIVFTVEKVLVQFISVNYHARSFSNRISEAKRQVYLLGLLFDASRQMFPMYGKDFLQEDLAIHNNMEAFLRRELEAQGSHGTRVKHGRIITNIGRIGRYAGRIGGRVNTVFGDIAAELTGKAVLSPKSAQSIVIESLERTKSTKALAQRLWYSFVVESHDQLYLNDIKEVLGPDAHDQAEECFAMLDVDDNEDVGLEEMVMRLTELSLSRKAIAKSMHDVSQAIKALDNVLSAVALLISVFVLVSFLDTGFSTVLSTASTALLSLSFVFSVTAQEFLGSCIFLFVKHPYDISDRVDIMGPDGKNRLIVEQISLFYTGFKRIDDMESIQVPNNVLNTLWINNITRSKAYLEKIDIFVSFDTTLEDVELLRKEMENFVRSAENRREFQPDVMIRCLGVGSMDKLQLNIEFRHKSNWAVEMVRASRHSRFMCALVLAVRKVPIFGPGGGGLPLGAPENPSYNVAVSDAVAAASREKAAQVANEARMANKIEHAALADSTELAEARNSEALADPPETAAIDAINSMRYIRDPREDDHDDINIDGSKEQTTGRRRSSSAAERASLQLTKSSSRGGRRQAGMGRLSVTSGDRPSILPGPAHAPVDQIDEEALQL